MGIRKSVGFSEQAHCRHVHPEAVVSLVDISCYIDGWPHASRSRIFVGPGTFSKWEFIRMRAFSEKVRYRHVHLGFRGFKASRV